VLNGSSILTNFGETLRFTAVYANTDLTDATVRVAVIANTVQAVPSALGNANLQIIDAASGIISFELSSDDASELYTGRNNWFRIELTFEDGSNEITPQIWINVE
jgi:hypothetical protein